MTALTPNALMPNAFVEPSMCVRYAIDATGAKFSVRLHLAMAQTPLPIGDAFPGDDGPIIVAEPEGGKRLIVARWGLTPHWAKDANFGRKNAYNARSETVREKPTFREPFRKRRCVVPASAIYERAEGRWLRLDPKGSDVFPIAGLWEPANDLSDSITFTMVTTEPNETVGKVHDRMPVILPFEAIDFWMAEEAPVEGLLSLLVPCPPEWLAIEDAGPVSRKKTSTENTLFS